jgi:chromosome partitioning protein
MPFTPDWNREAEVSVHLVQEILNAAGLTKRSHVSHWHPEFPIKMPKAEGTLIEKRVDFLIEDYRRHLEFLVEIKSAKNRIDDAARFQLQSYLRHAKIKYGILIDPCLLEVYEFTKGHGVLITQFVIEDPNEAKAAGRFLDLFLEKIKMRVIAINASKGGVGKTTLTVNLSYELAKRGNRVLVIDLDDQANASLTLGVNKANEFMQAHTVEEYQVLLDSFNDRKEAIDFIKIGYKGADLQEYKNCIVPAAKAFSTELPEGGKIEVLPSSYRTSIASIPDNPSAPKFLDRGLKKLAGDYDYVLIDTAPSFNLLAWNALYAAQYVLVPSQMEYLSAFGVRNLIQNLRGIQEETDNARGNILGIVPMMTEVAVTLNKVVEEFIKSTVSLQILPRIKRSTYIGQASHRCIPLSLHALHSPQARDVAMQFSVLTDEIIKSIDSLEKL